MFEYDREKVSKILELEGFELDSISLNEIKHVPMHQYRISSIQNPLLLIENLQVCIGLYAYSKNFGFAAHLNPVVIRGDEFECDGNKNIIYCNRIDDLFYAIINAKPEEIVYIGIALGFSPVHETFQQVDIIDKDIDKLILQLNVMDIEALKLELQPSHVFIVDTLNGRIITPSNKITKDNNKKRKL